ncbi:MAG: glycosyltransferase family 2 protein [Jatrophihabitans sp.]|uniref:glycosyltransferase family 2 protein n=1 Tax=Jatrophihabitans sp. TaxID=1932789 RepID=UPI003F7D411B
MDFGRDVGAEAGPYPPVSVIMTALEERRHLVEAVDSVFAQDYPGPLELVVAVGPSTDRTEHLALQLAVQHGRRMKVVSNPSGSTPAGLNIAIAAADPESEIIVRTDGHAHLPPHYVRTAVEVLLDSKAANVGGMMVPEGTTPFESAVARAMSRRIGMGSALFHVGGDAGPADSVYLGVFDREILERTGGFDEHFARAQDWELNKRIRDLGETVWFDPRLRVRYRPRPSVLRLAQQFHGSGQWRWQVIRRYPDTVNARYLAAPAATLALGTAAAVLLVDAALLHRRSLSAAAAAVPGGYLAVILVGAALTRDGLDARTSALYPVALTTMHLSWGAGFLRAALRDAVAELRARRAARAMPAGAA